MEDGSVEWFTEARLKIYKHTFAFAHMQNAMEATERLLNEFDKLDPLISSALLRTAVIEYGKPFSSSRGIRMYAYKSIKNKNGTDRDVHGELITLRHKLVAHQDDDFTDKVLWTFTVNT